MSEYNHKNTTSAGPLIATIVVAVLAIILAVVAILTLNKSNEQPENRPASTTSADPTFRPTDELIEECTYKAHDLVKASYKVIRLFVSEGLAHYPEPYGNEPEDGLYTVNSTEYGSLADIEALVNSVYVSSEAERIMNLGVYRERTILAAIVYEDNTAEASETAENRPLYEERKVIGIDAKFKPNDAVNEGWDSCSIAVLPKSETECELTIYLGGLDEETAQTDPNMVLETSMVKIDGEWKLAKFVY